MKGTRIFTKGQKIVEYCYDDTSQHTLFSNVKSVQLACIIHSRTYRIMQYGRNLQRPCGPTSYSKQGQLKEAAHRSCLVEF